MWTNAQCDGRPAEYRWRPLLNSAKFGWRPLLECCAVTLSKLESASFGRKVNFAHGKIPLQGKNSRKCIHSVLAQEMVKHRAKFGWPPMSDVAAVTMPIRETRWNLLGCPKLVNQSQPLVGGSSPYCKHMWGRYCCLTIFPIVDTYLSCEDIAQQSCAIMLRWQILLAIACVLYFSEPRAVHFRPVF